MGHLDFGTKGSWDIWLLGQNVVGTFGIWDNSLFFGTDMHWDKRHWDKMSLGQFTCGQKGFGTILLGSIINNSAHEDVLIINAEEHDKLDFEPEDVDEKILDDTIDAKDVDIDNIVFRKSLNLSMGILKLSADVSKISKSH